MNTIYVKPKHRKDKIRMPDNPTKYLPAEGAKVQDTPFWRRRISDGSVVEYKPRGKSTGKQ